MNETIRYGAYGIHVDGLESVTHFLGEAPPTWPTLTVERVGTVREPTQDVVEEQWAEYRTADGSGSVRMDRHPMTARIATVPMMTDDAVVHPGLALPSAIANHWLGRDAFHAGAFLTDSGAWAVLGAKEAGKSSILGYLAGRGLGVPCDDVLVVDAGEVLAGPRCIDLREGAATRLGMGEDLGVVGIRRRWRIHTAAVPSSAPLRGWIMPTWGDSISVEPVAASARLPILLTNLALNRVPPRPSQLLGLAALPFLTFRRPRCWDRMDDAMAALLDATGGSL